MTNNPYPFDNQPYHEANRPKDTNLLRFYKGVGNWSEFGLYFCGGLVLAFLSRLIPGMLIFYAIFKVAVTGYLWISHQGASFDQQKELRVIFLALVASTVGGYWDAVWLFVLTLTPIHWLVVAVVCFVAGIIGLKFHNRAGS